MLHVLMTWEALAAGAADALLSWILAPHHLPGPRHMGQGSLLLPFVIPRYNHLQQPFKGLFTACLLHLLGEIQVMDNIWCLQLPFP